MISTLLIKRILETALTSGGDFSEVFIEDTVSNGIKVMNGRVEDAITGRVKGIGIRVFKGFSSVYVYTNDFDEGHLIETAKKAALAIGEISGKISVDIDLNERVEMNRHMIKVIPSKLNNKNKVARMLEANEGIMQYSGNIKQSLVNYNDTDSNILIANSEGLLTHDRRIRNIMYLTSVASDGKENQTGRESLGAMKGFELFDGVDLKEMGAKVSMAAETMLFAKPCPAGKMPVVIDNGFGGVIFHEACGHSLEATSVAKGNSEFAGKIGEQIASEKVTAIDDGTIPNQWGSLNVDDEGVETQKNLLIKNGILKGYLIDKMGGRRMKMEPTGNSRRASYKFAPTSRMTNTYIAPGSDNESDIISSIEYGLYAKKMGGGSVNPVTGQFNFSVQEGYIVEKGEVREAVRGATLIGKGSEILKKIDMVGKELKMGQGMCGSASGSVPVNVGQPMIRVKDMTVGGR